MQIDVERANRAIDALRKPDASLQRVPNTVRQSIAEVIEDLLTGVARSSEQTGGDWQPIETFPRDGEAYLVCDDRLLDGFHQVVFWDDDNDETEWRLATSDGPTFHIRAFTHWKRLPVRPGAISSPSTEGGNG
ncbi:hypothetical protein IC762_12475 [Bradyrhizobium genosp. L]|uniref:hypothetical protein n=1 Tax=Bradyrhizobium genosp. L TaxID=83637 RepID=UPI0018A255C0|nr:hypothetical protein [Bradyrhizobium genosp. L]QPF81705.1 hypothetical protein IC762_17945 [Bradyrhizobium genosp. L]QPF87057.1 hypothetical protein IC762_12475 [Bradyrhizobium genosp. L]